MSSRSGPRGHLPPAIEKLPTMTHRQMVEAWKKDPEFKAAYDELETEFALRLRVSLGRVPYSPRWDPLNPVSPGGLSHH